MPIDSIGNTERLAHFLGLLKTALDWPTNMKTLGIDLTMRDLDMLMSNRGQPRARKSLPLRRLGFPQSTMPCAEFDLLVTVQNDVQHGGTQRWPRSRANLSLLEMLMRNY